MSASAKVGRPRGRTDVVEHARTNVLFYNLESATFFTGRVVDQPPRSGASRLVAGGRGLWHTVTVPRWPHLDADSSTEGHGHAEASEKHT